MIEKDSCTPQIMVNLDHAANKALRTALAAKDRHSVIDISRRFCRHRRIESRYLRGETRIGNRLVKLKIPLSSIVSVFSKEHKVGYRFEPS